MNVRHLAQLTTASLLLICQACSSTDTADALSCIPANSLSVTKIDANQLSPTLQSVIFPNGDAAAEIETLLPTVDGSNIYLVQRTATDIYATFTVTNPDAFAQTLGSKRTPESMDGFTIYAAEGSTVMTKGNVCWISENAPNLMAEQINVALKLASKNPITHSKGIANALQQPHMLTMCLSTTMHDSPWITLSIDTEGNSLTADTRCIYPDGSPAEFHGLKAIDSSALAYVPGNAIAAAAVGIAPDMDWNTLATMTSKAAGVQYQAMMQMLIPYLRTINGTLLVAFGPKPGSSFTGLDGIESLDFIMMIGMSFGGADQAVAAVTQLAPAMGLSLTRRTDGMYTTDIDGTSFYFGNTDGYLCLATFPPAANGPSQLTAAFNGQTAAAAVSIPSLSFIDPDMDFGIDAYLTGAESQCIVTLSLPGTDGPILTTLLEALGR